MIHLARVIDVLVYVLLLINTLYLLFFSLASLLRKPRKPAKATAYKRFAVLIAAYREDKVIVETVQACLKWEYPQEFYDVVVISDHMRPETNATLTAMPIKLLQVDFEHSTNTKSLQAALNYLNEDDYDVVLVLDADNYTKPSYLSEVNDAFALPGIQVVQTHRVAKNLNTDMAYLDGISEEINNSIFRLGHVNAGFSAALIGSGMAFEYALFKCAMMENDSVGGFDRVLEMNLLYKGVFFHYLQNTFVYDEKVKNTQTFYAQRRRWLAAQYYDAQEFLHQLPSAIKRGNWDFCDKVFQQITPSRVLQLGFVGIITLFMTVVAPVWAIKWWILLAMVLMALILSIPRYLLFSSRLLKVIVFIPYSFLLMFINLFHLRRAKKVFIHTEHGD
jgi:cellulose synthase/poly-beta-1,6-N-acetylglucosamine synthase-like glycosyltransferase